MNVPPVYLVRCPTKGCPVRIVLPPQILPEKYAGQLNPSIHIWPINYLCHRCGQTSLIPDEAIHQEAYEKPDQNQLIRYLFSNGRLDSLERVWLYTTENEEFEDFQQTGEQSIERILKPSGIWDDSWGPAQRMRVEFARDIRD